MLPKKTPRRKCRDHEREWRGFCVDNNLENDWLERLNELVTFDLISICEGHCSRPTEPSRTPPHVKLRLKENHLPGIASRWDNHKMAILSAVNRLFQTGETYVNLELKFKLRSGTGRLNYQEEMIIRIHGRRERDSEDMDEATRAWFQQCIERVEELDRLVMELWEDGKKLR
jgi:hypothetical protein